MGRKTPVAFGSEAERKGSFPLLNDAHPSPIFASMSGTPEGCDTWRWDAAGSRGSSKRRKAPWRCWLCRGGLPQPSLQLAQPQAALLPPAQKLSSRQEQPGTGDTEASRSVGAGSQTTVPWRREKSSSPQLGPQALTQPKLSTSAMTRSTRSAVLFRRIEHHCQRAVQRGRYLSSHKLAHSRDIAPCTESIPMLSGY